MTDDRDQCMPTPFLPRASDSTYSTTGQLIFVRLNTRKRLRADRTFSSQREADVYPASLNIHKSSVRVLFIHHVVTLKGLISRVTATYLGPSLTHQERTYMVLFAWQTALTMTSRHTWTSMWRPPSCLSLTTLAMTTTWRTSSPKVVIPHAEQRRTVRSFSTNPYFLSYYINPWAPILRLLTRQTPATMGIWLIRMARIIHCFQLQLWLPVI
jgi:hypothetical protein